MGYCLLSQLKLPVPRDCLILCPHTRTCVSSHAKIIRWDGTLLLFPSPRVRRRLFRPHISIHLFLGLLMDLYPLGWYFISVFALTFFRPALSPIPRFIMFVRDTFLMSSFLRWNSCRGTVNSVKLYIKPWTKLNATHCARSFYQFQNQRYRTCLS